MTHRPVFSTAQYDTIPRIRLGLYTVVDNVEVPVVLAPGDTATFTMWPVKGGESVIANADAVVISLGIEDVEAAVLEFVLEPEHVENAGTFYAQFKVIWDSGGDTRFPKPEPMHVEIAKSR